MMVDGAERLLLETERILEQLFPLSRSLSGPGTRQTLEVLAGIAPFDVVEVPSGTRCFDWTVPDEWFAREAWIAVGGRRVLDLQESNLHLVGYSIPFEGDLTFEELRPHLHTLPDTPDATPYRTSYYSRTWGFCLSQRRMDALDRSARFHVKIDAELRPGGIPIGERVLQGHEGADEFVFTTYACHPSLANDNLSGPVLWALLMRELSTRSLRNTYRFVIAPETIGIIAWLARTRESEGKRALRNVRGGYVLGSVAGPDAFSYKPSFIALKGARASVDRSAHLALSRRGDYHTYPFEPIGSDERQLSAPGWRIPVGSVHRSKYHEYREYHTSLDDLDFISARSLIATLRVYLDIVENLEADVRFRSRVPDSEPMLGRRGLYPGIGGAMRRNVVGDGEAVFGLPPEEVTEERPDVEAFSWLTFFADGDHRILEVAEQTGIDPLRLLAAFHRLRDAGILEAVIDADDHPDRTWRST
jgi:aminopeptidase-like protein